MTSAWEQFGQRRLALTRWQCEPQAIPEGEREAFNQAWARQRFMEQAIVNAAQGLSASPALHDTLASSLSELLAAHDFSDEQRQSVIHHHVLMELQFARITEQVPAPDDLRVLAWYQQHQDKFMRPEQRLARHLLLTVNDDRDAMRRQALQFYRDIQASRDAFAQLAKRYSHCPSALEGGRLGWISRGLLYPELESALFALPDNGLAAPVETELGWHLIGCEGIRPPRPMPQEDALEKAREFIWRQSQQQWQQQWLTRLLASM